MRKLAICAIISFAGSAAAAQSTKTEFYDLVKKLAIDSTGNENTGDWAVGKPKIFPVIWKADKLEMSEDTSINFYRRGSVDITINGHNFMQGLQAIKWNILLKGPRMGYRSYSIVSSPLSSELRPKYNIDSIFGKRPFTARLLQRCDTKELSGYYYYEVKLPKKDIFFLKISWVAVNGNTALRMDCFDYYSKYAAKLDCPK
ncbi:MAG: hypothetical protein ABIX01_22635 [Chitinophagaceae bacterium]